MVLIPLCLDVRCKQRMVEINRHDHTVVWPAGILCQRTVKQLTSGVIVIVSSTHRGREEYIVLYPIQVTITTGAYSDLEEAAFVKMRHIPKISGEGTGIVKQG